MKLTTQILLLNNFIVKTFLLLKNIVKKYGFSLLNNFVVKTHKNGGLKIHCKKIKNQQLLKDFIVKNI